MMKASQKAILNINKRPDCRLAVSGRRIAYMQVRFLVPDVGLVSKLPICER